MARIEQSKSRLFRVHETGLLRQVLTEKPAHPPSHLILPPQPVMVGSRYKLATEGLGKRLQNWL